MMTSELSLQDLHRWRRLSRFTAIRDIAITWILIVVLLLFLVSVSSVWLFILFSPMLGAFQNRLTTLLHDSLHRTLHPKVKVSDFLGRWFCAYPVGNFFFTNLIMHKHHHQDFAGRRDPNVLAYTVDKDTFLKKDLVRSFLLLNFFSAVFNFNQRLSNKFRYSEEFSSVEEAERVLRKEALIKDYIRLAILHALVMVFTFLFGILHLYAYWILVRVTWCSAFNAIRLFVEHHSDRSDANPILANNIKEGFSGLLERFFIAPLNFNLHGTHHVAPFVPYYLLPELTTYLSSFDQKYFVVRNGYVNYIKGQIDSSDEESELSDVNLITR